MKPTVSHPIHSVRRVMRQGAFIASLIALIIVVSLSAGLFLNLGQSATAKTVAWLSYDVDLTLQDDGSFRVEELQTVYFSGGPFSFAFAEIPLTRVDAITNIEVTEIRDGESIPYRQSNSENQETFSVEQTSSAITINWSMPTTFNEPRTFLLAYDVIGGLRVYESESGPRQQIWWTAIAEDVTDIAAINSASFEIHLPAPVEPHQIIIDGPGPDEPSAHSADGQNYLWTEAGMGSGDSLEARIEFPALVNATVPSWQQADDDRRLREQDRNARQALLKIIMAAAGVLFGVAGGVGLFSLWYSKGRDPGVGVIAEYLSEPPDDLPPGAAGALVDEYVNQRDIVATLTDLGHRGVLSITETKSGSVFARRDFEIELKQAVNGLRPFERAFVTAIMGSGEVGSKVQLGSAKARFGQQVEQIEKQMYEELVKRGHFQVSPETTRSRYRRAATTALIIVAIIMVFFGGRLIGLSPWILIPICTVALVFGSLYIVAKVMPRKTYEGAETAAKWRAFKRYLADLDQNRATEGATQLFDKYLPYAVAFGLEHSWVQKFANAGAPPPDWYGGSGGGWTGSDAGRPYRRRGGGWGGWTGMPPGGGDVRQGGGLDMPGLPDIQDASDSAGKSLQSMSGGLLDLFDLAGSAFESFGSSSSRGGGSRHGGFSGGGRSGGGGGRSGGGGGGSRGFG